MKNLCASYQEVFCIEIETNEQSKQEESLQRKIQNLTTND